MIEEEPNLSAANNLAAELRHYRRVVNAFDQYRRCSLTVNNRRRKDFYRLPLPDQALLPAYPAKLNEVDDRIRRNADVLDEIIFKGEESGLGPSVPSELEAAVANHPAVQPTGLEPDKVTPHEAEKVRSTLRQLVRDWSSLGVAEREASYTPILERLDEFAASLLSPLMSKKDIRVLVPGSGLGRLVWEIANRGYTAQGNEFSYQMLLAANLVLNHAESIEQWTVYPFVHSFSNLSSSDVLLKEARFPDVLTSNVLNREDFGISVGEFSEIFLKPEEEGNWHAVVTCFFIDTAQNIVNYIRTLHHLLRPNGIWINLGPTLWHFEASTNPMETSIELDVCEIKDLCRKIGFEFEVDSEKVIKTTYASHVDSNFHQVYSADYWVAFKKT